MTNRRANDRRLTEQDRLMTDHQAAELAGVPTNTVRYWRQTGVLPFVKVGKHPRIWLSVFLQVFKKPLPFSPFGDDKMQDAGDIRRPL